MRIKRLIVFNEIIKLNLQAFASHVNVTTDDGVTSENDLSAENKVFYARELLKKMGPELVHSQGFEEADIPLNSGKTIEFRGFKPLEKATAPLTEGVTPDGKTLDAYAITAVLRQYGDYILSSDFLQDTAIDKINLEALELLADQAGLTIDTIDRNAMQAGTNVSFCPKKSGGDTVPVTMRKDLDKTAVITVDALNKVRAKLKGVNCKPFEDGYYRVIIHPDITYDLQNDPDWKEAGNYAQPANLLNGEIGRIRGFKFLETSEAQIYAGKDLTEGSRTLTVKTAVTNNTSVPVKELITDDDVTAFAARDADDKKLYIGGTEYTVSALVAGAAGSASITLSAAASIAQNAKIASKGGAADGSAVYGVLIYGKRAGKKTKLENKGNNKGIEVFVKPVGSSGAADPLNQRGSMGWKAARTTKITVEDYIVRLECCSSEFSDTAEAN